MAALGKDHVDIGEGATRGLGQLWSLESHRLTLTLFPGAFDKKYKSAFNKLASSMGKEELRQRRAQMPTPKAIDCRKCFGALLEC